MTSSRRRESRRSDRNPKVRVKWVRVPIKTPRGRALRVLIYARFSTDEQKRRSIKAQAEFCKRFLAALGVTEVKIVVLFDEAMSGELVSRPGIDRVREGIAAGEWDLILVEDSSRLFRDAVNCLQLVRLAVDKDIRTICINDFVDTTEPDWEQRLTDAARHHEISNRHCSYRVKRAHEELWDIGAAIGLVKPGHRRRASVAAKDQEPEEGPFFDEVDPKWVPAIRGAYERIAAGQTPWSVAHWLTDVGLPKSANSRRLEWSDKNVIALIRRKDYRGHQTHRDHIAKKEYSTGKHKPTPNDPEEVLKRDKPELRMVEDWLWYAANEAIDARAPKTEIPRGPANPHYGVPRDSRGPLSGIFRCRCSAKMQVDGRVEGGYRCSLVRRGECWNKATALRDQTHRWLSQAIIQYLEGLAGQVDTLVNSATYLLDDGGQREAQKTRLQQKQVELEAAQEQLLRAIELGKGKAQSLVPRLEKCEIKLERIRAKLERLNRHDQNCTPPTCQEVCDRIQEVIATIEKMDRSSRDAIKMLVGTISAVPYQQFGSKKVVLRAKFTLHMAALLPARTRAALRTLYDVPIEDEFERVPMLVDLFNRSAGPEHGLAALQLQEKDGLGLTAIGKRLGITKRQANIAVQYGRALRDAGLTDPYIELKEPPAAASRWRNRRHQRNSPDSSSELPHAEPKPKGSTESDSVPE